MHIFLVASQVGMEFAVLLGARVVPQFSETIIIVFLENNDVAVLHSEHSNNLISELYVFFVNLINRNYSEYFETQENLLITAEGG